MFFVVAFKNYISESLRLKQDFYLFFPTIYSKGQTSSVIGFAFFQENIIYIN